MSSRAYVATRKGVFTMERSSTGANPWRIVHAALLGDAVSIVMPDARTETVYAALGLGHFGAKMRRSRDGGVDFEERPAPVYPAGPDEPLVESSLQRRPIPLNLEMIWALAPGGPDQQGRLWCGTVPGGLFRSDDSGETWTLMRSLWDHPKRREWFGGGLDLPGIHSICVDPRNASKVTVGVSCGGVWITSDDGESWECRSKGMWAAYMPPERKDDPNIQDPHCVAQCFANPDCLWVQHHNGVFKTTNGAESWSQVASVVPSDFGFPIAVHPQNPDIAWTVPAVSDERRVPVAGRVVVARTTNGGADFSVLTKGLPQEHAYDIVFRHCLDVDATGDRLMFGSTTGSLWVTEDQGDRWQCISNHLPPIYCVRFAEF